MEAQVNDLNTLLNLAEIQATNQKKYKEIMQALEIVLADLYYLNATALKKACKESELDDRH